MLKQLTPDHAPRTRTAPRRMGLPRTTCRMPRTTCRVPRGVITGWLSEAIM